MRAQTGVYVIVHRESGRTRYVGQSGSDIDARLRDAEARGRYEPRTDVVVRKAIHDAAVRDNTEASLIRQLDPTQNVHAEKNYGIVPRVKAALQASEIKEKLQILSLQSKR